MFGFSPTKLLFTALIIAAVWYGFKWFGRYQEDQKKKARSTPQQQGSQSSHTTGAKDAEYEELVACSKCGDFVVADKRSGCGKEGCPYDK